MLQPPPLSPAERALILHREDGLWVFYKPAGLATHPGDKRVADLVSHAREHMGAPAELSPVHRLDKETSGVLLMSPDPAVRAELGKLFAEGLVDKRYLALVQGPMHRKGVIRKALSDERRAAALPAVTRYRSLERLGGFTLIRARPQTGRKHQIRRHLQMIGRPIVGDKRYPGRTRQRVPAFPGRLWLHALSIALPDGRSFEAPLSVELAEHLRALGSKHRPLSHSD